MKVISVNVGLPREVASNGGRVTTGIFKSPVSGSVPVRRLNLDGDRQADARRQPAKMLAFTGVKTGMKVLDMEASAGYSTELLARVIGPRGAVYAQESAQVMERVPD